MTTLSPLGGYTFPEDPERSCAQVLPLWSAAVDPRVLAVRAVGAHRHQARLFDVNSFAARLCRDPAAEHIALNLGSGVYRLDVIEGTVAAGPVSLRFDVPDDGALGIPLETIRAFRTETPLRLKHQRLARRMFALHALDAKEAGASLREIAEIVLGPGDWPGAGEHRKSRVRRLLETGARMVRAGPRRILALRGISSSPW